MPENFVRKPPFLHHDVPLTNSTWLTSQPNRHPHGHLHPAAHHRCPHPPQLPISIAQGSRNHTAEETPKPQLVAGSIGHPFAAQRNGWRPNGGGDDLSSPRCLDPIKLYLKKNIFETTTYTVLILSYLWKTVFRALLNKKNLPKASHSKMLSRGAAERALCPWDCTLVMGVEANLCIGHASAYAGWNYIHVDMFIYSYTHVSIAVSNLYKLVATLFYHQVSQVLFHASWNEFWLYKSICQISDTENLQILSTQLLSGRIEGQPWDQCAFQTVNHEVGTC